MKSLKIISFYRNEKALIKRALDGNQQAQRLIYETHAPKMLGICRRYIKDLQFAEDTMIVGFVKVFKHLHTYRHEGSFEGWIRRIMIRESISFLRKKQFVVFDDDAFNDYELAEVDLTFKDDIDQLQKLIDALPEGYKMVFVLHAVEGYKHLEIADMLGISESTSKSQLYKARRWLQKRLKEKNSLGYGTH